MRLEDLIVRGRVLVVGVLAAVTVLATVAYSRLVVENKLDAWFPAHDPEFTRFQEFRRHFGEEDTLFVVLHAPDLFTRDVLAHIDRLTRAVAALPVVGRTVSLTNIEDVSGTGDGIEVLPLVPDLDLDAAALARLRTRVLADRFLPGTIVSPDGRTTVVVAELRESSTASNTEAMIGMEAVLASLPPLPGLEVHVAGWPVVNVEMDRLTSRDVVVNFPAALGMLAACVALFFRSLRATAVVVATVLLTVIWTMGAFAGLGFQGTFVTVSALPGILLPLVVATAVHVVARFQEELTLTPDSRQAMRATIRGLALPIFLTSATEATGFGSLAISSVPPLRHLGLFAALGMGIAFVLSLTFVPIALGALPWRGQLPQHRRLGRALAWVIESDLRHPRTIVAVSLVLAAIGALGMLHLRPQGSSIDYLPSTSVSVRAMHFIEERFGGASTIDVVVSGPPDVLKEPAATNAVVAVEGLLRSYPVVSSTFAYTDLLRRMNQALHDGDPRHYRVPDTKNGIAQQLLLYESSGGAELPRLVDLSGYDVARVSGRMTSFLGSVELAQMYDDLRARLAALPGSGGSGLRAELTGEGPLWLKQNLLLTETMRGSALLAVAGISAMMVLLVRSLSLGLLAMVPNVIPIVLTVGIMGWAGIHLDFATVTIASVASGIAVDDTIHYLTRFREELEVGGDPQGAMRRATATVGKANIATSWVLAVGMLALVTSSFPPHRTFGAMMALTVVFAVAGDVFLLPALLTLAPRFRRREGVRKNG